MAKGSGGTRGGRASSRGIMSSRASQLAEQYLGAVSDAVLKKELAEGLADFEKEFGLPENLTIKLGDIGVGGKINGLNRLYLNSGYENGMMNKAEAKKTFIHELAHGIDKTETHFLRNISGTIEKNGTVKGVLKPENKVFEKKLTAAYKHFKLNYNSKSAKEIGKYALKSKHEFFAESLSAYMTGTKNKYSAFAYNLAKSMSGK